MPAAFTGIQGSPERCTKDACSPSHQDTQGNFRKRHRPPPVTPVLYSSRVCLGSKASRRASPMKIRSTRVPTSTRKVESDNHQASILALPWARSSPRLGVEGGTPKPRKSRLVRANAEGQKGNDRRHAVGQQVPVHDAQVSGAQRPGRAHIVQIAPLEELGPDIVREPHPAKE